MDIDELILVSVDDHLVEPPTLFDAHIPDRYRDRAPKIVHTDIGDDVWMFDGEAVPYMGLNAVAGRPREEYGIEPMSYDEMRRGCWDVHERVKDMNAGGVLSSLNFPSFPGFAGRLFAAAADKDLALAVVQAYNDWHIDEWCGAYPDRFIPMALPVLWDPELAAAEVRRTAAKGCHSLTFTENPALLDYPSFHSDAWDPLWAAVLRDRDGRVDPPRLRRQARADVGRRAGRRDDDAAADGRVPVRRRHHVVEDPAEVPAASGSRSPRAARGGSRTSSSGSTAPTTSTTSGPARTSASKLPSEMFREHFLTCFIDDPVGRAAARPHRHRQRVLGARLPARRLGMAERAGGARRGARRRRPRRRRQDHPRERHALVLLRPVRARARVSSRPSRALRAESPDHDVSIRSLDGGRHARLEGHRHRRAAGAGDRLRGYLYTRYVSR